MSIHDIIFLPLTLLENLGLPSVLQPIIASLYLIFAYGFIFVALPLLIIANIIGKIRDKFSSRDSFDQDSLSSNYFYSNSNEDSEFNLDEFRRTHMIKKQKKIKKKTNSKSENFKKKGWRDLK